MPKPVRNGSSVRAVVTDKREAILRAATKVFAGRGYFNSKVSDIAGEAGIADGTVYLYFKSKDEILHSIFDRAMAEFIAEGKREIAFSTVADIFKSTPLPKVWKDNNEANFKNTMRMNLIASTFTNLGFITLLILNHRFWLLTSVLFSLPTEFCRVDLWSALRK